MPLMVGKVGRCKAQLIMEECQELHTLSILLSPAHMSTSRQSQSSPTSQHAAALVIDIRVYHGILIRPRPWSVGIALERIQHKKQHTK